MSRTENTRRRTLRRLAAAQNHLYEAMQVILEVYPVYKDRYPRHQEYLDIWLSLIDQAYQLGEDVRAEF